MQKTDLAVAGGLFVNLVTRKKIGDFRDEIIMEEHDIN